MAVNFSGSLVITGSLITTGTITMSGSIASASFATNATSASFATQATSASFALTASYIIQAQSASYWSGSIINAATASYVLNAVSASYWSGSIINAATASYVLNAVSASFALTASYISGSGGGVGFPFSGSAVVTGSLFVSGSTISGSFKGDGSQITGLTAGGKIHTQTSAASTWTVTHNLGVQYPNVTVYNASNEVIIPQTITATDANTLTLTFGSAVAGYAVSGIGGIINVQGRTTQQYFAAATTWSFAHNLGDRYVSIQAFDDAFEMMIPTTIRLVDATSSIMLFESASSGYAVATIGGDLPAISSSYAGYTLQVANSAPYSASWVAVPNVTVTNAVSSSFAATASSADNLTVRGTLTAQTINVQTITSSIEFITGSTRNGSIAGNTHQFTGSVSITGSATTLLSVNNSVLFVSASGNVGIGTSSPQTILHINSPASTNATIYFGVNGTMNGYLGQAASVGSLSSGAAIGDVVLRSQTSLSFTSGGDTERMRINSLGFVKANNAASYRSGAALGGHEFSDNSSTDLNHFTVYCSSASTLGNILRVVSDRNTTNGTYNLIQASGPINEFIVRDSGNCVNTNNSYGAVSDIKLKENITDATPKLDDLLKVKIRNYNLIADENKTKQIGIIAQELEEVFPGLIEESDDTVKNEETGEPIKTGTTTKSIKYSVFVPMLIKAVQELKSENDTLKEILQRNNIQ